jgi:hypothetical protein
MLAAMALQEVLVAAAEAARLACLPILAPAARVAMAPA